MAGLYLDTSALGRILLAEPDAVAIRAALANYDAWWSSELLVVELRRLAVREGLLDMPRSGCLPALLCFLSTVLPCNARRG